MMDLVILSAETTSCLLLICDAKEGGEMCCISDVVSDEVNESKCLRI